MTTIAYRDGVLAADTQSTEHDRIYGKIVKIRKRGGLLASFSGEACMGRAFADWFVGGMEGEAPEMELGEQTATGIIYFHPRKWLIHDKYGWDSYEAPFYAHGSGAELAIGAMEMGASAEGAVRVASIHDIYTGGDVTVLRLGA